MVSVITCTMRKENMRNVFKNYLRQTWKQKELIIVLNNDEMSFRKWRKEAERYKNVSVYQLPEKLTLGECLNFAIKKAKHEYIAKFDDDDYYAPRYLEQAVQTLRDSGADVVGKTKYFTYFEESKTLLLSSSKLVAGATLVFKKNIIGKVRFPDLKRGSDTGFKKMCLEKGLSIVSSNQYNFVYIRNKNHRKHTWNIKNKELQSKTEFVAQTDQYKPLVGEPENPPFKEK